MNATMVCSEAHAACCRSSATRRARARRAPARRPRAPRRASSRGRAARRSPSVLSITAAMRGEAAAARRGRPRPRPRWRRSAPPARCRRRAAPRRRAAGTGSARVGLLERRGCPSAARSSGAHAGLDALRVARARARSARACRGSTSCAMHRAVDVLDQRMDDALRVDQHLDALGRHVEQPVRLDHLEALVHHGRRVDRDLAAHHPVGMRAGLLRRDAASSCSSGVRAERPAGGGEHDASRRADRVASREQALEHGVVLAVDRQQLRAAPRAPRA